MHSAAAQSPLRLRLHVGGRSGFRRCFFFAFKSIKTLAALTVDAELEVLQTSLV